MELRLGFSSLFVDINFLVSYSNCTHPHRESSPFCNQCVVSKYEIGGTPIRCSKEFHRGINLETSVSCTPAESIGLHVRSVRFTFWIYFLKQLHLHGEYMNKRKKRNTNSQKKEKSKLRSMFPILRSASPSTPSRPHSSRSPTHVHSRQTTLIQSRPTTPSAGRPSVPDSFNTKTRHNYDARIPCSTQFQNEGVNQKDSKRNPSRSKCLLKALFSSQRKTKKDDTLYLDEY